MHCVNNAVIMQTKQLGRIEALEEELRSSRAKMAELELKTMEQDWVIAQLVGDNLEHLQDNMHLTTHINSTSMQLTQLEERMGMVGTLVYEMVRGAMEGLSMEGSLSEAETSGASGKDQDNQDGEEGSGDAGVSLEGSMRVESPMPWEGGLIAEMEREAMEAGAGGWFNRNTDVLESWSGHNSVVSASQDCMGTTVLTTIGGRTLPNLVRVPDNIMHPAVLRPLMEGPIRPWQCLVWSKTSPSHVLLQISPSYIDIDSEFSGAVMGEEEGNEGGDASVE